jgi:hypothetical protein
MNDLNELFELLAEEKRKKKAIEDKLKASIKEDINGFFAQLGTTAPKEEIKEELLVEFTPPVVNNPPPTPDQRHADTMASAKEYLGKDSFQQPEPDKVALDLRAVSDKIKFLEQSIGRIAAAGPGSGEVNLRWLDDVDRASIYDMRYMRYNATSKKFEFAEVNPHDIVYTTQAVTTSTYTINDADYYVGVNYAGPTTITLPTSPSSGRMLIIKDESGNAETNPITVVGTVDNDTGGFVIQINNGGVQLLYRNGWRIV